MISEAGGRHGMEMLVIFDWTQGAVLSEWLRKPGFEAFETMRFDFYIWAPLFGPVH